jgi:hypothetical protein
MGILHDFMSRVDRGWEWVAYVRVVQGISIFETLYASCGIVGTGVKVTACEDCARPQSQSAQSLVSCTFMHRVMLVLDHSARLVSLGSSVVSSRNGGKSRSSYLARLCTETLHQVYESAQTLCDDQSQSCPSGDLSNSPQATHIRLHCPAFTPANHMAQMASIVRRSNFRRHPRECWIQEPSVAWPCDSARRSYVRVPCTQRCAEKKG